MASPPQVAFISLDAPLAEHAPRLRGVRLIPEDIHPTRFRGMGFAARRASPLFCLAPRGVCLAPAITRRPVGSYPAFSPLPFFAEATKGGMFSVTLSMTGRLRFQPPRLRAARCLVVSGLSSPHCLATTRSERPRPTRGQFKGVFEKSDRVISRSVISRSVISRSVTLGGCP